MRLFGIALSFVLATAFVRPAVASHPAQRPEFQQIVVDHARSRAVALGLRAGGYVLNPGGTGVWGSLCPAALGYEDSETYPGVALEDGSLVVSLGHAGIARADATGCGWRAWQPETPAFFVDLRAGASLLFALSSSAEGPLFATQWWTSSDGGASFEPHGERMVSELYATSFAIASQASRRYVAGSTAGGAVLLRSDDSGASWQRFTIEHAGAPRVIGVPSSARDLVVVLLDGHTHDAAEAPTDGIHVSYDGGAHFEPLYTGSGDLAAAALSEDGRLAFGGPDDGLWVTELARDATPTRRALPPALSVQALAWAGARLFAGVRDAAGALSLHVAEGAGFAPVVSLCEHLAPLACSAGAASVCSGESAAQVSLSSEAQPWCSAPPAPGVSPPAESEGGCGAARAPARGAGSLLFAALVAGLGRARRTGKRPRQGPERSA